MERASPPQSDDGLLMSLPVECWELFGHVPSPPDSRSHLCIAGPLTGSGPGTGIGSAGQPLIDSTFHDVSRPEG
jgi:hypothetical protein